MTSDVSDSFPHGRCCIFQPFDSGGEYDKRYDEIIDPAVRDAGMEPYRVDRDESASVPLDTLHREIRSATACIADITNRNANVMYELGYATAADRDVLIISGPNPERFPFDIQHRKVIRYLTTSPSDFQKLGRDITKGLEAILTAREKATDIAAASPVKATEGLNPHEITALALIMSMGDSLGDTVSASALKDEMRKAGFTPVAARLSIAQLVKLGLAQYDEDYDSFGNASVAYRLTQSGEQWLLDNQDRLELKAPAARRISNAPPPIKPLRT
jgi:hypothetical protein